MRAITADRFQSWRGFRTLLAAWALTATITAAAAAGTLDEAAAAYQARDYGRAASLFGEAAKQGDPQAQNNLATMYLAGLGIKPDAAEAARWFRLSADQGFAPAQVSLGELYFNGPGVPLALIELTVINSKAGLGFRPTRVSPSCGAS